MLTSVIINPDITNSEQWDKIGSSEPSHIILSDGSDSTYVETIGLSKVVRMGFSNAAHVDNPIAVRVWSRAKSISEKKCRIENIIKVGAGAIYYKHFFLSSKWQNYYAEWTRNPDTGILLSWDDIDEIQAGIRTWPSPNNYAGGQVSKTWIEVITSSNINDAIMTHGPCFVCNTTTLKCMIRASNACDIKLRYGVTEDGVKNATAHTDSDAVSVDSTSDFSGEIELILNLGQRYYFDFLIDDQSVYAFESGNNNAYWDNLPTIQMFPAEDSDINFCFLLAADIHVRILPTLWDTIGSLEPKFMLFVGDWHSQNSDDITEHRMENKDRCGSGCVGESLFRNVQSKIPCYHIWSDHDFIDGDSHKVGGGDYGSEIYKKSYNALDVHREYHPQINQQAPGDIEGTDDGAGTTTTIYDTGAFVSNVYPGMVVHDLDNSEYAVVQVVTNDSITTTEKLTSWVGVNYRISCSGIYQRFKYGNAEFFLLDCHYKKDPNNTPGGDMLDGVRWGSLAKKSGTTDGDGYFKLIQSGQNFSSTVNSGDVVMNTTDNTCALVEVVVSDTELQLSHDIMDVAELYVIYESGGSEHGSKINNEAAGHIQREWLIDGVNSSTAKWKFIVSPHSFKWDEVSGHEQWSDHDPLNSLRNYLRRKITTKNVIFLHGDRHAACMDDGSHSLDPWPSVCCGNAGGNNIHSLVGDWLVGGERRLHDSEVDIEYDDSGSFCMVRVSQYNVSAISYTRTGLISKDDVNGLQIEMGIQATNITNRPINGNIQFGF